MTIARTKEPILLFFGDATFFLAALWVTLAVRYLEIPGYAVFYKHLIPFSFLFLVWILVFFIAGLYGKHTVLFKSKLFGSILNAQIINVVIAAIFFFFIPYFGITPKTNLIIYLFISSIFILIWRFYMFPRLGVGKRQKALLFGSGREVDEIANEVNNNTRYNLEFIHVINPDTINTPNFQEQLLEYINAGRASVIVGDTKSSYIEPLLSTLYSLTFLHAQFRFIDIHKLYENIFDRIPVSLVGHSWFLSNISRTPAVMYDFFRRILDITVSFILGILSLIFYPFVIAAIKIEDGGAVFITQERVGKDNTLVNIIKFRSMKRNDSGEEVLSSSNEVTRVGWFMRKLRIDELPQLWNVFKGDLSLIGPRPELPALAHLYAEEVPYYNARHLIKPGLSGWAQIYHDNHPHHASDVSETKVKLSYDLYYIKNRSLLLDIKIALKTIKTLFSRSGI
jgi:lipopolysaccharide/colanic/teichoic acid biosynthesis glycosyltransferase